MPFCGIPRTWIENVAFHDAAVRIMRLQGLDEIYRQQVQPMRLTAVQLNAYFACHTLIDFGIDFQQSVDADILRKEYLGFFFRAAPAPAMPLKSHTATVPNAMALFFIKRRR
jgi:hypothetical protein